MIFLNTTKRLTIFSDEGIIAAIQENNNQQITFLSPDLDVNAVNSLGAVSSGSNLLVNWEVKNNGPVKCSTGRARMQSIYHQQWLITADPAILLGDVTYTNALLPGQSFSSKNW